MSTTAKYAFLPWIRKGIANEIDREEGDNSPAILRPRISVSLEVNNRAADAINTFASLAGPGDVKNINLANILRSEPVAGALNHEPNFFPYIEFYDEFFPWRFTPAVPRSATPDRLTPWLFLAVLADEEFTETPPAKDGLPGIRVKSELLPDPNELWATAHVQVVGELSANNAPQECLQNLQNLQGNQPDVVISRIMSPRIMQAFTNYTAFLIPVYEVGRRTGLGLPDPSPVIDVQTFAWDNTNNTEEKVFPYYHKWSFKTNSSGDFETLTARLQPKDLGSQIGKRPMDMAPALEMLVRSGLSITPGQESAYNDLSAEGALASRQFAHIAWESDAQTALQNLLNLGHKLKNDPSNTVTDPNPYFSNTALKDDPVVIPHIYGRWHTSADQLTGTIGWLIDLNLDPQYRAAAGLGAQIVQDNQEAFMAHAWAQIGEVMEANKKIVRAELAKKLSESLYNRHISTSSDESLLEMTGGIQTRIALQNTTGTSVRSHVNDTLLPNASRTMAFRKTIRPRGNLARKMNKKLGYENQTAIESGIQNTVLTNLNDPGQTDIKTYQFKQFPDIAVDAALVSEAEQIVVNSSTSGGNAIIVPEDKNTNVFTALTPVSVTPAPVFPASTDLPAAKTSVLSGLTPATTFPKQVNCPVDIDDQDAEFPPDVLKPVWAYPKFPFAMFDFLKKISPDWIIPNIHLIPDNTIALLQTNQRFIEAFMVGLNHEFGRELLWREYPTDQRGTYFRNFWSTADDLLLNYETAETRQEAAADIKPIDQWENSTPLGSHKTSVNGTSIEDVGTTDAGDNQVVLLIRGELLRKYPNATIYAQKARWQDDDTNHVKPRLLVDLTEADLTDTTKIRYPRFKAQVKDAYLLGFNLTLDEAKGQSGDAGWYFVMKERSGETRFGLDIAADPQNPGNITSWSQLTFSHFNLNNAPYLPLTSIDHNTVNIPAQDPVQWEQDAAQQAHILFQPPVLVAIHATRLLSGF